MKLATLSGTGALLVFLSASPAQAESYQTCTGYITSIPATITKQGMPRMPYWLASALF